MTNIDLAPPAPQAGALFVPLRRRDGTVRAWAVVDEAESWVLSYMWHLTNSGYARRNVPRPGGGQQAMMLHRELMGLGPTTGKRTRDRLEVDHIDGDRLNNRRANLRFAKPADQAQNVVQNPGRYSAERGVSKMNDRERLRPWHAYGSLVVDGKKTRVGLGMFATEEEAVSAVRAWRAENMPFAVERSRVGITS